MERKTHSLQKPHAWESGISCSMRLIGLVTEGVTVVWLVVCFVGHLLFNLRNMINILKKLFLNI